MTTPTHRGRGIASISPDPDDNAGRLARPKGEYQPGLFKDIKSVSNFAHALGVPIDSIKLVVPKKDVKCRSPLCPFDAIEGNDGRCPAHQRSWYPLVGQRGSDLLGPEFMRFSRKSRVCDCDQAACISAGYFPNQDPISISIDARDVVLRTPGLFSSARKEILGKRENKSIYLNSWHFFPEHREINNKGKWRLKWRKNDPNTYKDPTGMDSYTFPPPRYSVQRFLGEEYFIASKYVRPQDRWMEADTNNIPRWMQRMIDIDRADPSITPNPSVAPNPSENPFTSPAAVTRSTAALQIQNTIDSHGVPLQINKLRPRRQAASAAAVHKSDNTPTATSPLVPLQLDENYWKESVAQLEKEKKVANSRARKSESDLKLAVARSLQLAKENQQMKTDHQQQLAGMKRKYDDMIAKTKAELEAERIRVAELEARIEGLEKEIANLRNLLEETKRMKGRPLRYIDLYPGGVLAKHVNAFTPFPTIEQNDAFISLMNHTDGSPGSRPEGDGYLENIRPYSKVTRRERDGEEEPPSLTAEEYAKFLRRRSAQHSDDSMTYKDDYLAYWIYVRAGTTSKFTETIVGCSNGRMSDIFHGWSNVLDDKLREMFPRPTRSQMLQRFPQRTLEADGHARNWLLLDAVEIFAQKSSNNNVASSTHSEYKKHTTVKFLAGCDPIGCVWDGCVPDGNPGRISDVIATIDTKILRQVPFGHTGKTDKGFLVDNEAAREGVINDRPQKRQNKQIQQSASETGRTQKVGNTRINVENVNGGVKNQFRFFNGFVQCNQFGIISKVVRIAYFMQNFRRAIIQNHNYFSAESEETTGRPCRADIRWCGASDAGLRDVRGNIHLWGSSEEIRMHKELSAMTEHKDKTSVEISEMIFEKRVDLQLRKQLYREIHHKDYDGGDL